MTTIPNDPLMLVSFLNMKLRDFYPDLHALCEDLELNEADILEKMSAIDYHYAAEQNRFV